MILIGSIFLSVCAQTMLKFGSAAFNGQKPGVVQLILDCLKSPLVIAGFGLYGVAALLWTYALSKFDLSYVNFVGSLSYVLVILISIFLLHESVSAARWIGCGFILIGVFFVLRS